MTAIQTLKNARTLAAKEVESARKAHTKFKTQAETFNKAFTEVKATLLQAEVNLKALDDALKAMGETKAPAPAKIAERKTPKVQAKKAAKVHAAPVKAAPAKTAKVAAKKVAKIQAKTKTPKVQAKKAPKKSASRQAAGRREVAENKRPTIRDAMMKVMGTKVMSRQQVFDLLKAKGWLPNSNDPLGYVGYLLSATKAKDGGHLFERVAEKGRGFYRVKQEAAAPVVAPAAPKAKRKYTKKAAAAPKAAAPKAEAKVVQPKAEVNGVTPEKTTEQILKEAGIGTDDAPFG